MHQAMHVRVPGVKSGKMQLPSLKIQRVNYENPHTAHGKSLSYVARLNLANAFP